MSCMFYFNWWEYDWESKFFSDALSSAAGYSPGLSLLVVSLSWHWGRQGREMDTSCVNISGTLLVTLCNFPQLHWQRAIRAWNTFSLGHRQKSWGLRCPHQDHTDGLGLNLEQGSGSHHWALSSQALFAAISHQMNKNGWSERTGYGNNSPVFILLARNIKHKAN